MVRGMCGSQGVCVAAGGGMHGSWEHAWQLGVYMAAGGHAWQPEAMCGSQGGHVWQPGSMHGIQGACMEYNEIWSMSGQYASYWNAFLFVNNLDLSQVAF